MLVMNDIEKKTVGFRVTAVKDYISTHIHERIAVHDIAREMKVSASYLNSSFKKQTGECITSYIQKCKINEAQSMLRKCQYTITDIWTALGYFDQSHFNKSFKKVTGITPLQYRQSE